jgi:hypothetical protein
VHHARTNIVIVARELFQTSLVTYLILVVAETLKEGFVSNFFNMNYLLGVVLTSGTAMVLAEPDKKAMVEEAVKSGQVAVKTVQTAAKRTIEAVRPRRRMQDISPSHGPAVIELKSALDRAERMGPDPESQEH